eukprot:COSAG02_NODE_11423_length_1727_cov_2.120393_3_plen_79_part_00
MYCISNSVESPFAYAAHTISHTEGIDKHRPDWDDAKYGVLLTILRAKFSQHPDLAAQLVRSDILRHNFDSFTIDSSKS